MPEHSRRALLTAGLAALALSGAAGGCAGRNRGDRVRLRYATPYAKNHPFSRADAVFFEVAQRRSDGALAIAPFWGGSVMGDSETLHELRHGVADLSYILPIYSRAGVPLLRTTPAFYMGTRNMAEQEALFRRLWETFPVMRAELPGIRPLIATGGSQLEIITASRPVRTLDDLRGLRLRTPAELAPVLARLGVDSEFLPMGEVYTSMSRGTIDGLIAPVDVLKALRLVEVARYCTLFNISRGAYPSRGANERVWQALSPELRAAITDSLPAWSRAAREEISNIYDSAQLLARERGVEFISLPARELERFAAVYEQVARERAARLDERGLPGTEMYEFAQRVIESGDYGSLAPGGLVAAAAPA